MGFFLQLKLLLWKNFTLRKRQWFRLALEIVSPLLLFLILVIVRTRPDLKESHPECHFDGKAMPSAGVLPFLQTMFCTFNNTCHTQVTEDERAGSIQSFNQSLLTALVRDFEIILGNRDDLKLLEDAAADISTLSALLRMLNNQNTTGGINVGNILINPSNFSQQLQQQNISLSSQVTQQLLSASLIPSRINMSMIAEILGDLDTCAIPNSSHLSNITNAVNMTGLPTSLPQTNTSVLPNSVSDLQRLLCAEGRLAQILQFADSQTANNVQSQVCNLTTEDFLRFVNTFRDDIDIQNLEKEVRSFILMNVGRELLSDPSNFLERIQQIGQEVRNFYYDYRRAVSNELDRQDLLKPLSDLRSLMSGQAGAQSFGQLLCGRNFPDGIIDTTGISQSLNSTTQRFANTFAVQSVLVNDDDDDDINQSSERKCNHTHSRPPWRSRRCRNLISSFTSTRSGSTLWKQLLPFVRGYIHYYPDTPEVRKIIEESNKTFDGIASFGQFAIELSTYAIELENVTSFLVMFTNSCYCDLLVNAALGFDTSSIPSVLPLPLNASTIDSIINMAKNLSQSVNGSACKYVHNLLVTNPVNVNGSIDPGNMGQFINVAGIVKLVQEMASSIGGYIQCLNYQKFVPFNDYETFMSESQKQISSGYLWGALQFDKVLMDKAGKPQYVEYRIRMDPKKVDSTKKIRDKYWRPGPRRDFWDTKYTLYGFSYLQDMIDHAIIRLQTESKEDVGIYLQMFPYPCYTEDKFVFAISRSLPLFLVLAWILTVALICKNIVHEKEVRLKEVMKIMGLGNGVHWVAWFINAFVIMFLTIILLTIVVKGGKVIEFSDASVLMVFFTVFAISTIMQCFLVSTFFNRANLAACCAGFIYFVLYLPYTLAIQWEEYMTNGHKFLACLSSSVAFGFGCSYIARYEEQGVGIQWSNIAETPVVDDQFNMLYCIFLMIFDSVLYGIATWYIEAVFPGQYGIPRKFYFPFQKSYWCGGSSGSKDSSANYIVGESTIDLQNRDARNFETEPVTRALGVSIRNLKKVYHQGNKTAVDGLSLNFYEGQITSFLGHNGAGKTTTMSILTGLFPPTDGTAYIYGKDIRTNMDDIRKSIGMCPQYNVLFDHLTVEEHMWFYARLRGLSSDQVKTEMEQMIKDVGLPHKRKEVSSSLSGGMKRKLSVAIAFVGGAKTVILDEPTAGVDPYARRSIWELLFKVKKDRTIILSTHHMDEADVLGDRIAIISQGKLCCCGSSLFLKSRYGNGYYLTMVRSSDKEDEDYDNGDDFKKAGLTANGSIDNVEKLLNFDDRPSTAGSQKSGTSVRTVIEIGPCIGETEDEGYQESLTGKSDSSDSLTPPPEGSTMLPGYSVKRITSFVQKYVHDSQLVEENNTELIFRLPDEGSENGQFQRLFKQLEKCHKDLGISSFGISDTSLEEVFLKVTEGTLDELDDEYLRTRQEETSDGGRYPKSVTRLSFRRKKKKSFLKILQEKSKRSKRRVDSSTTDLMGDTDSVVSEPVSDMGDKGFNHKEMKKIQGKMLYVRQLIAILIRRFHHVRRSKKGFLCEIILPAVFILLAMIFSELTPPVAEEPKLELHPWMYVPKLGDQFLYMFYSNDGLDASEAQKSINMMLRKPGIGNRCLNDSLHTIDDYPCPTSWRKEEPVSFANSYGSAHYPQCSCTTGQQVCPGGAGGPVPPMAILPTSDRLFNMTSRNVSDWLVKTYHKYMKRRYGGFSFGDVDYRGIEAMKTISNASKYVNFTSPDWKWFKDLFSRDVNKIWYDNKGWAAIVIYTNVMNNILMRSKSTPGLLHPTNRGIVTHNHPIEYTQTQLEDKLMTSSAIDIVIAICVIFAMSFIPASFTLVLIEERASNSKHLQFVSGVNPTIYWISNFLWDLLNYLVPCMLMLIIFKAFNRQAYVGDMNGGCLVALLCLYGWAMIPLMYPFTRLFNVPSTAMVTLQAANIFLGTTTTLATYIITFLEEDDEDLKAINNLLKKIFLIFPQYCLGRGLMDMSTNYLYSMAYTSFGFEDSRSIDPFEFDQVGKNLLSLFIIGIGFFVFNILIEYNFCIRRGLFSRIFLRKPVLADLSDEDVDVAAERRRVLDGTAANDVLRIEELVKVYPVKAKKGRNTAVDRLCVGVPKGQCFGLLGVNGAGKTTTFKMLTGDVTVSQGDAYVNGYSILRDRVQVNRSIGYCPQFDAFDNLLTGREILSFFARLRGVPEKEIKEVAEWAIRKLNLKQYADKIADGYSGGNKRKLSTAISLIGNPSIIFLDEPTTGMDPRARRFLWNCINAIVRDGRSVILTSHSMEECEALCNRLGIMVNGSFKCLGSPQHLKNRFGDGYTVIIRVAGGRTNIKSIKRYISRNFPGSELREEHNNMVQYQMPGQILLSYLFQQIEAVKEEYSIEDYSVSQTTLDHVFINFAKMQTDLLDDVVEEKKKKADVLKLSQSNDVESQMDEESRCGSTVELFGSRRSQSDVDNIYQMDARSELTEEESLAGSQVDLIRHAKKDEHDISFSNTRDRSVPSIDIF